MHPLVQIHIFCQMPKRNIYILLASTSRHILYWHMKQACKIKSFSFKTLHIQICCSYIFSTINLIHSHSWFLQEIKPVRNLSELQGLWNTFQEETYTTFSNWFIKERKKEKRSTQCTRLPPIRGLEKVNTCSFTVKYLKNLFPWLKPWSLMS